MGRQVLSRLLSALLADTDSKVASWLEVVERGFDFAEKAATLFKLAKD